MAIELPSRGPGSTRRTRGIALPGVENIGQVRSQSVAASRVPVPRGIGGDDLAAGINAFAEGIRRAEERQQKQFDAVQTTEAQLAFEREAMEEFRRLQVEDDPSRPDFIKSYDEWLTKKRDERLTALPKGVSEFAREGLRLKLASAGQGMVDSAGRLSLQAGQKRSLDAIQGIVNKAAAQASRDPDFLDNILQVTGDDLGAFRDTMSPDAERDAFARMRATVIRSAVSGMVTADRYKDAEALIKSGKFDADMDPVTLAGIQADIKRGQAAAKAELRDLATDHFASLAATGVGVAGLKDRAKAILDGKDLAEFNAQERASRQVYDISQKFKFASPDEMSRALAQIAPKPGSTRFADEQRLHDGLAAQAERILRARERDPAGYALQAPQVADAFRRAENEPDWTPIAVARSLAVQAQMGIPESARRVLPEAAAKAQVAEIAAADPERAADTMLSLSTRYGKHWPSVFGELVREKLPPEMQVLGVMDTPNDAITRKELAQAMKAGRKTLADTLPPEAKTAIDREVATALQGWAKLELARGATEANVQVVRSSAELLAYAYTARGLAPADAVKKAANALVLERSDLLDSSGFALYVPKGMGADVERAANQFLGALKSDDLPDIGGSPELTPEQRKAEYLRVAKRGRWVLNEGGNGAVLLDPLGQPVMLRDGSRAQFLFSNLMAPQAAAVPDVVAP